MRFLIAPASTDTKAVPPDECTEKLSPVLNTVFTLPTKEELPTTENATVDRLTMLCSSTAPTRTEDPRTESARCPTKIYPESATKERLPERGRIEETYISSTIISDAFAKNDFDADVNEIEVLLNVEPNTLSPKAIDDEEIVMLPMTRDSVNERTATFICPTTLNVP
jgi:hypothetical protein